ncbi:hypothetical protein SAMN05216593_105387 [Pseudomonas asturiensis]|uniref:Uncharacterized protein n=1 Tax=Pseudomonas asturiensis TaxID=1190415 RepID=A0A1M7NBW6_9PSED|nr:hypothetical protein SAMN05216593_105387 [Pseudomonas asturiensis]
MSNFISNLLNTLSFSEKNRPQLKLMKKASSNGLY